MEAGQNPEEAEEEGFEEVLGDDEEGNFGVELADDLFMLPKEKRKQTRAARRRERHAHGLARAKEGRVSGGQGLDRGLHITRTKLQQLQEADGELAKIVVKEDFYRRDGLLYRRWIPRGRPGDETVDQIVLPRECRRPVLQLAYTVPLGGHLGKKKMTARVMRRFYWPTLHRDVADFCRSCEQCQKSSHQKVPRAPMIPLPVIGEPFERIAMDGVGPLPRSCSGHRYILVICDYATRYPEAV